MGEREPIKEVIQRGDLFFLDHPGNDNVFSGYGIAVHPGRKDALVGLLMVDQPRPVDPQWLREVEETFGEYQLVPMTASRERGILCRMQVETESTAHLQKYPFETSQAIQSALQPLLEEHPKPYFRMSWDAGQKLWLSQILHPNELPKALCVVLKENSYGCLAVEADIGIVHVCHAPDKDIAGFADKPVITRWQLVKMPTAPLIRLELLILDRPQEPFLFESFLNVAEEDQAHILSQLANQENLYLAFYGDDLRYRFTKIIPHDSQQWQLLDELAKAATQYWNALPPDLRDFDQAKSAFIRNYPYKEGYVP